MRALKFPLFLVLAACASGCRHRPNAEPARITTPHAPVVAISAPPMLPETARHPVPAGSLLAPRAGLAIGLVFVGRLPTTLASDLRSLCATGPQAFEPIAQDVDAGAIARTV